MIIANNKYSILIKLFDITKPNANEIITLILEKNNQTLIYKNKKSKRIYNELPTVNDEGQEFELISTNDNFQYCSIKFLTYGMEGEIATYNIEETNYNQIYSILVKFYNLELEIVSKDAIVYI